MSLFIPVGLPGCGKSTYGQRLFGDSVSSRVYSSDAIRLELCGDMNDMSRDEEVFDCFHDRIAGDLEDGRRVFADATNLRDFARKKLLLISAMLGFETHVIVFTNVEQAIKRNQERERVVPEEVMVRFIGQYERALLEIPHEDYDSWTYIAALN